MPKKKKKSRDDSAHPDNMLRTRLGGEHTKHTRATANVEHSFALEQVAVVHDRGPVGVGPDLVFEHLLVNAWVYM
jgi:hypothetical protein